MNTWTLLAIIGLNVSVFAIFAEDGSRKDRVDEVLKKFERLTDPASDISSLKDGTQTKSLENLLAHVKEIKNTRDGNITMSTPAEYAQEFAKLRFMWKVKRVSLSEPEITYHVGYVVVKTRVLWRSNKTSDVIESTIRINDSGRSPYVVELENIYREPTTQEKDETHKESATQQNR